MRHFMEQMDQGGSTVWIHVGIGEKTHTCPGLEFWIEMSMLITEPHLSPPSGIQGTSEGRSQSRQEAKVLKGSLLLLANLTPFLHMCLHETILVQGGFNTWYGKGRGMALKSHTEAVDVYGLIIHEKLGIERALGLECGDKMLLASP